MTTQWAQQLSQFRGSELYYRITPDTVMTEGAKFVADNGEAYWLMTAIASYLPQLTKTESFIVANLQVGYNKRFSIFKLRQVTGNGCH